MMKHWMTVLSVLLTVGFGLGCDRKPPPPERPTVYDPDPVAGSPAGTSAVSVDLRYAEDQRKISNQIAAAESAVLPVPPGPAVPTTRPVPTPPTPPEPTPPTPPDPTPPTPPEPTPPTPPEPAPPEPAPETP